MKETKIKWYDNPIKKSEIVEKWKQGYKKRLETDITLQYRQKEEYKQWRSDVFNYYNGICEKCGAIVYDISVTYRQGTMKEVFKLYNIETLQQAIDSQDITSMKNSVLQCKVCYKVKRNKKDPI